MTSVLEKSRIQLSGNAIKTIAIVCMVIDHVAWAFVPTFSALGQVMHLFGRVTAPVMCFFIAEGYAHTHDVNQYFKRLLIFAIISDIPFMVFERSNQVHNVIFTLLLGLMVIRLWDKVPNKFLKILLVAVLCIFSAWMNSDWSFIGVLLCLAFWVFRGKFYLQSLSVLALSAVSACFYGQVFQFGMLLCLPFLYFYNGQRGGGSKWTFYIFYPAHLAVLGFLRGVI